MVLYRTPHTYIAAIDTRVSADAGGGKRNIQDWSVELPPNPCIGCEAVVGCEKDIHFRSWLGGCRDKRGMLHSRRTTAYPTSEHSFTERAGGGGGPDRGTVSRVRYDDHNNCSRELVIVAVSP